MCRRALTGTASDWVQHRQLDRLSRRAALTSCWNERRTITAPEQQAEGTRLDLPSF